MWLRLLPLLFMVGALATPLALTYYGYRTGNLGGIPLWPGLGASASFLLAMLLGGGLLRYVATRSARVEVALAEQKEILRQVGECGADLNFRLTFDGETPAEGSLLSLSVSGMRLSGYGEGDLATLRSGEFLSGASIDKITQFLGDTTGPALHGPFVLDLICKNGEFLPLRTWLRRIDDGAAPAVDGFVSNKGEWQQSLQRAETATETLGFLNETDAILADATDLIGAAAELMDRILEYVDLGEKGWGAIYTLDDVRRELTLVQARGGAAEILLCGERKFPLGEGSLCGEAALSERPRFSHDCRPGERSLHGELDTGDHSHCAVPLWFGSTLTGVLLLTASEDHTWTDFEMETLGAIGRRLGEGLSRHAISQAHLEEIEELTSSVGSATELVSSSANFMESFSNLIATPLGGMLATVAAIGQSAQDPNHAEHLSSVQQTGESLMRLLENLTDYAKLERGDFEIERVEFAPRACIRNALNTVAWQAKEKGIDLKAEVERTVPKFLIGDPNRLTQILINLFGNGIKASESGSVLVRVKRTADEADLIVLQFSVQDSSAGTLNEQQQQILADAQLGGTGNKPLLGPDMNLVLAAMLVKRFGGRIWAQSSIDQGNTINFNVQLATSAALALESPAAEAVMPEPVPEAQTAMLELAPITPMMYIFSPIQTNDFCLITNNSKKGFSVTAKSRFSWVWI
jgi:signal transduction histidine kinase